MNTRLLSKILASTIKYCYIHPVSLELLLEDLNIDEIFEEIENRSISPNFYEIETHSINTDDYFLSDLVKKSIKSLTWDSLPFGKSVTDLEVFTRDAFLGCQVGRNSQVYFPETDFFWQIHSKDGITLLDLTESIYRVKSFKHDWCDEYFCGIKVEYKTPNSVIAEACFTYY